MKILLAAATPAEIAQTQEWLQGLDPEQPIPENIDICITGVGLLTSTFRLTKALAYSDYDLVIGAGIAGAYDRSLKLGQCVVVNSEQLADFGAEDGPAFLDAFDMGLESAEAPPFTGGKLLNPLERIPGVDDALPRVSGLTVLKVSGNEPTIEERTARYGAAVESMEGAALHYAALSLGIPFIQLRSISNYVTRRDRSAWQLKPAIDALNAQLMAWLKRLL
jgi:futalosine hydrolase